MVKSRTRAYVKVVKLVFILKKLVFSDSTAYLKKKL